MFFHTVYKSGQIFLPFCQESRVWQTDRRTDGRTEYSSLDRVCISCSAVKTSHYEVDRWFDGWTNARLQINEYYLATIVRFRWLEAASGTVCRPSARRHLSSNAAVF